MSDPSLSLIRSRTVRRPISALRWETREKMLVGGDRKPLPQAQSQRRAGLLTRPARRLTVKRVRLTERQGWGQELSAASATISGTPETISSSTSFSVVSTIARSMSLGSFRYWSLPMQAFANSITFAFPSGELRSRDAPSDGGSFVCASATMQSQ